MLNSHRIRLVVILLLFFSFFVSTSSLWTPNVSSALTLSLFPTHAPPGYGRANNASRVQVSGSGFVGTGSQRNCAFFAFGPSSLFDNNPNRTECRISGVGAVSAFFSVSSNAGQGSYTINVTDTSQPAGSSQRTKTISFTVDAMPDLVLNVHSGSPGTTVTITSGSHKFAGGISSNPDVGMCDITSMPSSIIDSPSCFIDSSGNLYSTQFRVRMGATDGGYEINVTGSHGDFGLSGFTVISGPTITVSPSSVPPGYGTKDGAVIVSGPGYPTGKSRDCTTGLVSSGGAAFFATSPSKTCTIDSSGTLTGSFAVAAGAINGSYRINVTDPTTGARGTFAFFNVSSVPLIKFNVTSAAIGKAVSIETASHAFFTPFDVGPCSITADPSSPALFSTWACTVDSNGNLTSPTFFRVAAVNPTTYTIIVTAKHGETASNVFSPAGGPTVTLLPKVVVPSSPGPPPVFVSVTGAGFNPSDVNCTISFQGNSTPIADTVTCAVASGNAAGSFRVITSVAPGSYLVNVTGLPSKDAGFAILDVAVTAITTTTSTTYSPTVTSTFSTTTVTTTTGTSTSLSTTTFQSTGRYTEYYSTYTTTTVSAQSTTTAVSSLTSVSTFTVSTLTFFTTLSTTITHTLVQAIQRLSRPSSLDILALVGLAVVLSPSVFRRLVR